MTLNVDAVVRRPIASRRRCSRHIGFDPRTMSTAVPLPVAIVASAIAGAALDLAYPELGWWPVAFASVTIGLWTLRGRSLPAAFLVALVYGAAFYFTHLVWVSRFLGPIPWVALAGLESLLFGAGGMLIALAYRVMTSRSRCGYSMITPALIAGVWVLRETVMGTFPYTGFPWARIGFTLTQSPFAEAASWVGTTGLSFLTVLICASSLDALAHRRRRPGAVAVLALTATALAPCSPLRRQVPYVSDGCKETDQAATSTPKHPATSCGLRKGRQLLSSVGDGSSRLARRRSRRGSFPGCRRHRPA